MLLHGDTYSRHVRLVFHFVHHLRLCFNSFSFRLLHSRFSSLEKKSWEANGNTITMLIRTMGWVAETVRSHRQSNKISSYIYIQRVKQIHHLFSLVFFFTKPTYLVLFYTCKTSSLSFNWKRKHIFLRAKSIVCTHRLIEPRYNILCDPIVILYLERLITRPCSMHPTHGFGNISLSLGPSLSPFFFLLPFLREPNGERNCYNEQWISRRNIKLRVDDAQKEKKKYESKIIHYIGCDLIKAPTIRHH